MKEAKSRRRPVILGVIAGLVVAGGAGTTAYASYYQDRALPGVSVLGESITGQTREQLAQEIADRVDQVQVRVDVDGQTTTYGLDELGARVDVDATVDRAFAENQSFGSRLAALVSPVDVPLVTVLDDTTTQVVVQSLTAANHVPSTEASITFDEAAQTFTVIPGQPGAAIDAQPLLDVLDTAAATLESQSVTLTEAQVSPKISDETAQTAATKANELIGVDVSLTGREGEVFSPSVSQKAAWISMPTDESAEFVPSVDATKVREWVDAQAAEADVAAVDGVRKVNQAGTVLGVTTQAVDGWTVNNAQAVADALTSSLNTHQAYSGEFTFDQTKAEWTDKLIAAGTENLVYQAAPGEKWVDLDLGNNTVTAYEGGQVVFGPTGIVPGAPGMETPTGTYKVYLKYDVQTMRGTNLDGTTYVSPGVQWVSYFTGSIAFHAAPWQPSFGWSGPGGSHGCVNMSTSDAKWIYDWAGIGTTVVSHY